MSGELSERLNPEDVVGTLVVVVALLGFADVVPADDLLSTWLVIVGLGAVVGGRAFRTAISLYAERQRAG